MKKGPGEPILEQLASPVGRKHEPKRDENFSGAKWTQQVRCMHRSGMGPKEGAQKCGVSEEQGDPRPERWDGGVCVL